MEKHVVEVEGGYVALTLRTRGGYNLTSNWEHAYQCSKATAQQIADKITWRGKPANVRSLKSLKAGDRRP